MRYEFFITRHYFGSKKQSASRKIAIGSFPISVISTITVILAVAVPIIVLSIMNGLHTNIGEKIVSLEFDVRVLPEYGEIPNYMDMVHYLEKTYPKSIEMALPYFHSVGLVRRPKYSDYDTNRVSMHGVQVVGLRQEDLDRNWHFQKHFRICEELFSLKTELEMKQGATFDFSDPENGYMGYALKRRLRLQYTDASFELMIPAGDLLSDVTMEFKPFQLKDQYTAGYADFDARYVIIPFDAQKKILGRENYSSGIGIFLQPSMTPTRMVRLLEADDQLNTLFNQRFDDFQADANDTTRQFHVANTREEGIFTDFFREKQTIFYVLLLMVLAAFVTIYITLHVHVIDKRKEIGILKSFGTSVRGIQQVFVYEGLLIGVIGTAIGVFLGIMVSVTMDELVMAVEWIVTQINLYIGGLEPEDAAFHIMPTQIFYLDTFPVRIRLEDVLLQATGAIFVSLLASYLSSKRAALQKPLSVLRMEG